MGRSCELAILSEIFAAAREWLLTPRRSLLDVSQCLELLPEFGIHFFGPDGHAVRKTILQALHHAAQAGDDPRAAA